MAMNYTKSALLGQNPDMLSAQVEEAKQTYGNALKAILRSKGLADLSVKVGQINEALRIIQLADDTFSDEIKKHPQVATIIKAIQDLLPGEIKQVEAHNKALEVKVRVAEADRQLAEREQKRLQDEINRQKEESEKDAGDAGAIPEKKFPILPIAVAAGAIGLAFMIGS